MNQQLAIHRAQVYDFLADALLYPVDNWTEDITAVSALTNQLDFVQAELDVPLLTLGKLQWAYRQTFGAAGSLAYETEYGLPHEYRQSQEMADIAGFYRAFGFMLGGQVHERPDHIAVELEFMHILCLKEAYAWETADPEHVEICVEAQQKFLQDHLGRWIDLFAQSVAHNAPDLLYAPVAKFAAEFVQGDAARMGLQLQPVHREQVPHTPFDPDFSCATCTLPYQVVNSEQ